MSKRSLRIHAQRKGGLRRKGRQRRIRKTQDRKNSSGIAAREYNGTELAFLSVLERLNGFAREAGTQKAKKIGAKKIIRAFKQYGIGRLEMPEEALEVAAVEESKAQTTLGEDAANIRVEIKMLALLGIKDPQPQVVRSRRKRSAPWLHRQKTRMQSSCSKIWLKASGHRRSPAYYPMRRGRKTLSPPSKQLQCPK